MIAGFWADVVYSFISSPIDPNLLWCLVIACPVRLEWVVGVMVTYTIKRKTTTVANVNNNNQPGRIVGSSNLWSFDLASLLADSGRPMDSRDWLGPRFDNCLRGSIKYCKGSPEEHALHLLDAIRKDYRCSTDWTGSLYTSITLNWNYTNNTLRISMPGYVAAALHKFQHPKPTKPQDSPYQAAPIQYGAHIQMTTNQNDPPCDKKQQKQIQKIIGTFLYYARAIKFTMNAALGSLASEQSEATTHIIEKITQFLDEAEFTGLFINGKEGTVVRNNLDDLRWKQEPTEMTTDNTTADGIAKDTVKQNRSKAMDM
jgi:hypothetical protein